MKSRGFPCLLIAFLLLCMIGLASGRKVDWGKWPPASFDGISLIDRSMP